jgi:hypothetical protein
MKKLLALALVALTFTACEDAPQVSAPAPITFSNRAPIRLNVAQVKVIDSYRSSMTMPYIEHTLPTSPATAIHQWAGQRLIAAGQAGTLEITIEDAAVKQTDLKLKDGIEGFFTDQQSERYDAHVRVTMKLYDGVQTISIADADVDVSRMQTVNEKATVSQREKILNGMVQDIMLRFDSEGEARLRQYFARFIVG